MGGTAAGAAKAREKREALAQAYKNARYKVGRKPLKMGTRTLKPGTPVIGAESWPRLESWLRAGAIVER